MQALADLDQPDILVALDAGAVNRGRAAFAVVAPAVLAVEGEGDLFLGFGKEGLKILAGNRGVVVFQEKVVSQFVSVCHGLCPP